MRMAPLAIHERTDAPRVLAPARGMGVAESSTRMDRSGAMMNCGVGGVRKP